VSGDTASDFARDGFAGPFQAFTSGEMAALAPRVDELLAAKRRRLDHSHASYAVEPDAVEERDRDMEEIWNAHRRSRLVFDLATHPAVLAEVARVAGPDLLLWHSQFWIKEPGARRLEWHQDVYPRHGFHDRNIVTAWIALDEVTPENAVQLVPGTHRAVLPPEVLAQEGYQAALHASGALPPPPVDGAPVVMSLRPGEFFVFHQLVFHASPPNTAGARRAGLAARFLSADVDPTGIEDQCIRVAGRARPRGLWLVTPPPRWEWAANSTTVTRLRLGRRPWQRSRT
jgi:ectoine hydroxylase-related dioxygenase (phytanoyl-CoA dioxygenase family)